MTTRALKARLKKLEAKNEPPQRMQSNVARFTPEGRLVGDAPTSKRLLIVTDFGTDDEWQAAAIAQQTKLIEAA